MIKLKKKHKKIKKLKKKREKKNNFLNRILIVSFLTIVTLILLKGNSNFKTKFYEQIYEKSISFQSLNNLYQKYFGAPIPFNDLFKDKTVATFNEQISYSNKTAYLDGVELSVSSNYLVPAIESGMVIFVGEKENYGNTIIIEQVNGIEVWYSNITSSVKLYDYVDKGALIGEANEKLYLTFKKDGEILNYEEYI